MFARLQGRALGLVVLAALTAAAPPRASAQADEPFVLTVAGMFSGPLDDGNNEQYDVGGGGQVGVYRAFAPEVLFGLRVGAGALAGGRPVPQDPVERGALDWGALSASMRIRPLGGIMADRRASSLWFDVGFGPWLVDGSVDPVFDAAIGYGFDLGPIVLSPMLGAAHIIEVHDRYADEHFFIGNAGIELAWNDRVAPPVTEPAAPETGLREATAGEPRAAQPPPLAPEEDVARPFVNDQLVIDERVFFDYDRWEIRPTGVAQLQEVARRYEESGDRWEALVISGHADRRGPPDYNVDLSRKRADAVRTFLTSHGVPGEILEIQAWGESRPEIPDAETEYEHQLNRRVQFEIVWRPGMRPEGTAPPPTSPAPDRVDPAPLDRRDRP